ncbi:charged multivesicular body protein 4b [Limosa lapponica baueri]|uniref:Charged multivesicular body protein 4b n=1 Tax=Limosa lapponica baueri TaxID=1758121 RepID=A0A2I0TF53_LIMLA|nr:charged multivesicular body protein 4b [Limosa lapponica baueri]
MSGLLGKLFGTGAGGKGAGKGPSPQEAIQRLRETEEMLSKKQEFLEKKIEQELAAARKHGTKNKRGVLKLEVAHKRIS